MQWGALWRDYASEPLEQDLFRRLDGKLNSSASPADNLEWRADTSKCIVNDDRAYHLCMESGCVECGDAQSPGLKPGSDSGSDNDIALQAFATRTRYLETNTNEHHRDGRFKMAVEVLEKILQTSQSKCSTNIPQMATAIIRLAYYDNPVSRLFTADEVEGTTDSFRITGSL